ncbi:MAG: substrate-binding domain-containing protein [Armatimonadota bacterium]|jgi:LacI family transcriptional regulator
MGRPSISKQIAEEFRKRIAAGTYPCNSFLPSERELAAEFNTSRDTIAAALKRLVEEGFVARSPGRGTRVLPAHAADTSPVIGVIHNLSERYGSREGLRILEGIQDALLRTNFRHEFLVTSADPSFGNRMYDNALLRKKFQGVIYLETVYPAERIYGLHKEGFPVVVANLEYDLDVPCTCVNHAGITYEAVKLLVGFGHKRIAFLGQDANVCFYGKALAGYISGLEEAGIPRDESLIGITATTNALQAYSITKDLLNLPSPPTAIMAARDIFAGGAVQAVQDAGLTVGRDISIVGYDDISWPQEEPFLTTFREPCYELGAAAAEMLINRIRGRKTPEKLVIESPLIIRKSAGPLL